MIRALAPWLSSLGAALVLVQAGFAQAPAVTATADPLLSLAPPSRVIPRPPELQADVDFWIRVYSDITTAQGFLHDDRELSVVYGTIEVPAGQPGSPARRAAIDAARERWREALREAALVLERGGASGVDQSADVRRVLDLWGSQADATRLRQAVDGVRFQLGQADRFRAGIVRSGTWEVHIARTLERMGLPPELAALPHVESSFTPTAYSKVGASGLWQFMPATGRLYMRVDDVVDERLDPFRSTEAAARLLLNNYRVLGSWPLALTAYNHGTAGMRRARDAMGTDDYVTINRRYSGRAFGFASRNFYPSFLAALTIDQNPEKYFGAIQRDPPLRYHEVEMPGHAAIDNLESVLELSRSTLRELNPALRPAVWSGARLVPRGYRLRLPAERQWTAQQLSERLGAQGLSVAQTPTRTHLVLRGDTLSSIARRYGVSAAALAELNDMNLNSVLRAGRNLRIPGGSSAGDGVSSLGGASASNVAP
jgi:membrane-bound lytic murein transglycosylase D